MTLSVDVILALAGVVLALVYLASRFVRPTPPACHVTAGDPHGPSSVLRADGPSSVLRADGPRADGAESRGAGNVVLGASLARGLDRARAARHK